MYPLTYFIIVRITEQLAKEKNEIKTGEFVGEISTALMT